MHSNLVISASKPLCWPYLVSALVWPCPMGEATVYLQEYSHSTLNIQCRGSLCSSKQAELLIPCSQTTLWQRRAVSIADPATWNGLTVAIRLVQVPMQPHFTLMLRLYSSANPTLQPVGSVSEWRCIKFQNE